MSNRYTSCYHQNVSGETTKHSNYSPSGHCCNCAYLKSYCLVEKLNQLKNFFFRRNRETSCEFSEFLKSNMKNIILDVIFYGTLAVILVLLLWKIKSEDNNREDQLGISTEKINWKQRLGTSIESNDWEHQKRHQQLEISTPR